MRLAVLPNQDIHDDQPKQSFDGLYIIQDFNPLTTVTLNTSLLASKVKLLHFVSALPIYNSTRCSIKLKWILSQYFTSLSVFLLS